MRVFDLIRLGWKKPPKTILKWVLRKLKARRAARGLPRWEKWLGKSSLTAALDQESFDALLENMRQANPFPGLSNPRDIKNTISPEARSETLRRAKMAMRHEVDLLGSGPVNLGERIDWALDFKSGTRWAMSGSLGLPVNDLDNPSDIKVPWELSRLQWLLPVGQAYILEGDEEYAAFARAVIEDWVVANPVCRGPNWICAMDVALRGISIVWLFHACKKSKSWRDEDFLERLIKTLLLHGRFVDLNLEYADVNGNHLTSDLAGLTVMGITLGGQGLAGEWVERSWDILSEELPKQILPDGVCHEASLPYHRLVAELFLLPLLARQNVGLPVERGYRSHVKKMADITHAATRPDGSIPIWGDADDGRALPLGTQPMNDHRYLVETLATMDKPTNAPTWDETLWWLGAGATKPSKLPPRETSAFADAGVYIMRANDSVVFVDAGPVGMAGRGGHGHNDCLSVDVTLAGTPLIVDPGAYVYTSDWQARNWFRSTAAHNTPQIDGEEINRFVNPKYLWLLSNDAVPKIHDWSTDKNQLRLTASHSGYQRLAAPVTPARTIILDASKERLAIIDQFDSSTDHSAQVSLMLAPGIDVAEIEPSAWKLSTANKEFLLVTQTGSGWSMDLEDAYVSHSYGIKHATKAIVFSTSGSLKLHAIGLLPQGTTTVAEARQWLAEVGLEESGASPPH
jgi:uncharacterized heparinase superfamily protein